MIVVTTIRLVKPGTSGFPCHRLNKRSSVTITIPWRMRQRMVSYAGAPNSHTPVMARILWKSEKRAQPSAILMINSRRTANTTRSWAHLPGSWRSFGVDTVSKICRRHIMMMTPQTIAPKTIAASWRGELISFSEVKFMAGWYMLQRYLKTFIH